MDGFLGRQHEQIIHGEQGRNQDFHGGGNDALQKKKNWGVGVGA